MPGQICHVFCLLVWKNFQKQKHHKLVLVLSLVLPVMSSLFLLFIRSSSDSNMRDYSIRAEAELLEFSWSSLIDKIHERRAKMASKQRNFTTNVFIPDIRVAFAPNSNAALRQLMADALGKLSMSEDKIVDFGNCNDMRIHAASEHYLASVCFRNVDDSLNGLPTVLSFAIIMPSELRNYEDTWIGDSWKETTTLMDRDVAEDDEYDEDGYTDYMGEGFVPLQYHISMQFLRATAAKVEKLPKVLMRRFNENPNVLLSEGIGTSVVLLILLGFMFPVTILTTLIVEERELGQRYMLETLNASATLQMATWFLNVFAHFLITSLLITILLKIQWNGATAAINKCPWPILLCFLISYGCAVTSLIILMASAMRRSRVAMVMAPIIWLLLALPLLSKKELLSDGPDVFYGFVTVLLCNVSFSRGLSKIFYIEDYTLGVTIGKYMFYRVSHSDVGLFVPIVCFYIQTIFCILLALIFENNTYVWLAIRVKNLLQRYHATKSAVGRLKREIPAVSFSKTSAQALIEFRGVWQRYSKSTFVVQDITLSVYSGEVVALLGHNSSGKSTIVKMLYGLTKPKLGEIYLSGFNIVTQRKEARKNASISMSHKSLFTEFVVLDHLVFLSRLRGLSKIKAKLEAKALLRYLKLEDWEKSPVNELTIGQRSVLQFLCAFAGGKQIVILDKPFDGIDEQRISLFYTLILDQKKNRSIFFTSNNQKVASGIADRIFVIAKGKLQAFGTEKKLCRMLNESYRLLIFGNEKCSFWDVYAFMANFIPEMEMDSILADCASFLIKHKYHTELISLIENLARVKHELNVYSFEVHECSIDDILVSLYTRVKSTLEFGQPGLQTLPVSGQEEPAKWRFLIPIMHLLEELRQLLIADTRNWFIPILKLTLPSLVVVWALSMPYFWHNCRQPGHITFPMSDHGDGIILMQKDLLHGELLVASEEYAKVGVTEVGKSVDITTFIYNYEYKNCLLSDADIMEAVIYSNAQIEVLFNTKWPHTAPDSLARALNSLAVAFIGGEAGIKVELEVLPFSTIHTLQLHLNIDGYDLIFASCLSFCFCCIWSIPLLHMTLSRDGRYNYVELIAGMPTIVLIVAFLIYDLLVVLLALFPINIAVIFFHWELLMDSNIHIYSVYVVFLIAACVFSLNILITIIMPISDMPFVYLNVLLAYSLGILVYIAVKELWPFTNPNTAHFLLLDFHPFYALLHNLMRIASISEKIWLCSDRQIYETSVYADQCQTIPNCCDDDAQEFYHLRYLCCVYLLLVVVWISIFIFLKSHMVKRRPRQPKYFWDSDPDSKYNQNILHIMEPSELENTWIHEKTRVSTLERNHIESKALHVEHLSVFFGLKAALKHIDFMVNRYQVMSIFGANGTGKSVLLKTILGIYTPSSGRIISSKRVPYKSKDLESCHMVGYSAQEFQTMRSLSIMETWYLILRIRRTKRSSLRAEATKLCKIFGLYKYRFYSLSICSQGVLKRLSLGIALISDAELILLDDPFTHLDIVSQRSMLHIIHDMRRFGHSVIYTCSDTAYSTPALRMATLSYPGIAVIGEREELQQNYYASYYMVETRIHLAKLGSPIDFDSQSTEAKEDRAGTTGTLWRRRHQEFSAAFTDSADRWKYLKLCGVIENVFPHAIIKNVSFPRVCFWLSSHMYPMARIVDTLHRNKQDFYSYSVSQPSVNCVFLSIHSQKHNKDAYPY
ncbi:ATP-binding cassette sub-family A member 3 [Drosophila sechellia]|uniref:ATP-binding cassette sub-family A member 3 n=1 Tax=Drosophila sechellia TaxID=7238 RepID=UPI0013DDB05C|nr:ATP-binding cassette sub-family A member 3 [Drosophila sechellia]